MSAETVVLITGANRGKHNFVSSLSSHILQSFPQKDEFIDGIIRPRPRPRNPLPQPTQHPRHPHRTHQRPIHHPQRPPPIVPRYVARHLQPRQRLHHRRNRSSQLSPLPGQRSQQNRHYNRQRRRRRTLRDSSQRTHRRARAFLSRQRPRSRAVVSTTLERSSRKFGESEIHFCKFGPWVVDVCRFYALWRVWSIEGGWELFCEEDA